MLRNINGFSLIEIMVAAALLGIISLGVMRMMEQQQKSQKTATTNFEIQSLNSEITQHLLSSQGCKNTFDDLGTIKNGTTVSELKGRNDDVQMSVGDTFDNSVEIQNMELREMNWGSPSSPSGNIFGSGKLYVTFKKLSGMALGGDTVQESFSLKFDVDSSYNVISCYGATEDAVDTSKKESCENIGGTYDANTDMCDLSDFPQPLAEDIAISNQYLDDYQSNTLDDLYVKTDGDTMTGELTAPNLRSQNNICIKSNCRTTFASKSCPDGKLMKGINADGTLKCTSIKVVNKSDSCMTSGNDWGDDCSVTVTCPSGHILSGVSARSGSSHLHVGTKFLNDREASCHFEISNGDHASVSKKGNCRVRCLKI